MIPYVVSNGDISVDTLNLFRKIRRIFESFPNIKEEVVSCHAVCRAFSEYFPVKYVDGKFGEICDHSWLVPNKNQEVIFDIYPVAGASSFIVFTGESLLPWSKLYVKERLKLNSKQVKSQTRLVCQSMINFL